MLTHRRNLRRQFQLQDGLAVMVGYGMAAMLFRAFWPATRVSPVAAVPAVGLYLWLGMAMSGPIFLFRGPKRRFGDAPAVGEENDSGHQYTWAELAWSLIGAYWIVIGLFMIPARLHQFRFGDMLLFGAVPIVVTVILRLIGARTATVFKPRQTWTHAAAVVLVATWPFAWICLIILGRMMG